jgi:hypothetical protein
MKSKKIVDECLCEGCDCSFGFGTCLCKECGSLATCVSRGCDSEKAEPLPNVAKEE